MEFLFFCRRVAFIKGFIVLACREHRAKSNFLVPNARNYNCEIDLGAAFKHKIQMQEIQDFDF